MSFEELSSPGEIGIYVKVTPGLKALCQQLGVDVSATVRKALVQECILLAGRKHLSKTIKKQVTRRKETLVQSRLKNLEDAL
jgi:hypothetical protein